MKVGEHVTVEAARQQQVKATPAKATSRKIASRNDLIVFIGVIVLAILSVVALALKG